MKAFRVLLVILTISIYVYTMTVGLNHGWDLVTIFFDDLMALRWPGQFNLDFMSYLTLSALWLAWRHRFSPTGILLGLIGQVAGIAFFAPYLLVVSIKTKGDMTQLLLGDRYSAH